MSGSNTKRSSTLGCGRRPLKGTSTWHWNGWHGWHALESWTQHVLWPGPQLFMELQWGKFQPFALSTYVCLSIHRMFVDVTDRKKKSSYNLIGYLKAEICIIWVHLNY